jgi:hypothetical protein
MQIHDHRGLVLSIMKRASAVCSARFGAVTDLQSYDMLVDVLTVCDLSSAAAAMAVSTLDEGSLVDLFMFTEAHRFLQALLQCVSIVMHVLLCPGPWHSIVLCRPCLHVLSVPCTCTEQDASHRCSAAFGAL